VSTLHPCQVEDVIDESQQRRMPCARSANGARAVCPGRRSRNRLSPIADNGRLIIDRNFTVADEPAIGAILGGDFI
jgi:hypothetical protein